MSSLRAAMRELAQARADAVGVLDRVGYGNLVAAGALAADAFNMYEVPCLGASPRVSRAVMELAVVQAMRAVE